MQNQETSFIEDLVNQLEPRRSWPASWRSFAWFTILLVLNTFAFLAYQSFRPTAGADLLSHPRFVVEILSAIGLIVMLFYSILSDIVPGKKIPGSLKALALFFFLVLISTLYLSFSVPSPESTILGARAFCVEEVLGYGLLGLLTCFYFVRKSDYPFSRRSYLLIGAGTMLIPGFLMQLACMYSPKHALILHYGPVLVGLLFGFLFSLFCKTRD